MALLEKYIEKRNFKETPEPKTIEAQRDGGLKFVIQRHLASRLHYDFRLELEGVLKSWAVPKGPSLNPKDKRLAMMVEDHPFEYRKFEGEIPEGNYGAGIVEIWDEGTFHALTTEDRKESEKMLLDQLKAGSLKFVLDGKKLKGEFALVKLKGKEDNSWLLIKHNDKYAVNEEYDSEENINPKSKIPPHSSTFKALKAEKKQSKALEPKAPKAKATVENKKSLMPHDIKPMLAALTDKPFNNPKWLYEIKWDGYRAIAEIETGEVKFYSRNLLPFNETYPPIVDSLKKIKHTVILDGEIVVLNENGFPNFQLLQNMKGTLHPNLHYYVYDLLYLNGNDLRDLPLIQRKELLKEMLPNLPNIKYSDHILEKGKDFFKEAQKNKLEGLIAKDINSPYRTGRRSNEWLKIKTSLRQEAVIAGFTAPRGSRKLFGALVLGVYEGNTLKYIGHSGGGFNAQSLREVYEKLEPLIQDKSPFKEKVVVNAPVTWIKPELICEISFSEWTEDGHMRHPIFQGLREDKDPKEVVHEKEESTEATLLNGHYIRKTGPDNPSKKMNTKTSPKNNSEADIEEKGKTPSKKENSSSSASPNVSEDMVIDGQKLKLTNLDKVYWPEEKYTKRDLIKYYLEVSDYILPYLKDRPQSLNRHPNGINDDNFFQKDIKEPHSDWLITEPIFSESNDKKINYLICQNQATLTYMNNLGCIEINPWNSRIQSKENPDYIVIDLDPGENTFEEVIQTALVVKEILDKGKIDSYCKTSGATGLHIYIPLGAKYDYDQAKEFAHIIAVMAHEQLPELTSLERSPKNRRKQIYLDYLQNRVGQTLACAYSVRPKPGATVSTPLRWDEIKTGLHPSQFNMRNILKRLAKEGDLFAPVLGKGVDIGKSLKNLEA